MTEQESAANARKHLIDLGRSVLMVLPIALVAVIVTLALISPSVGNIFSNIVNQL
jgi:hypothetical protein